jgi:DNA-binding transcriptional ArsR family regulator
MGGDGRPYGVARPTAVRRRVEEAFEWSRAAMAEPVSAPVLAAIADPLRLALLVALERRPATPAELAAVTRTPEPVVEQALAILDDAGLVTAAGSGAGPCRFRPTGRGWTDVAGALILLDRASRPPGVEGDADPGAAEAGGDAEPGGPAGAGGAPR